VLPAGYEPAIPASGRPQTYTFYRAATGTGASKDYVIENGGREVKLLIQSNLSPETH